MFSTLPYSSHLFEPLVFCICSSNLYFVFALGIFVYFCISCHRNVLHALMQLTFVRATCVLALCSSPCTRTHFCLRSSCTKHTLPYYCIFCIFVFCRAALCLHGHNFARGVPVHTLWSNLPSHCLAIDWLCIAKFQSRQNLIHISRLPESLEEEKKEAHFFHQVCVQGAVQLRNLTTNRFLLVDFMIKEARTEHLLWTSN